MISKPTTEQLLRGLANDLTTDVLPYVDHEPAKVALGMITQMLGNLAMRAAHEIAWAHEEAAAIAEAAGTDAGAPVSLHLDDVIAWYGEISRQLSAGIEAAYATGDPAAIEKWRALIDARCANEQAILGQLDLVGRG